MNWLGSIRTRLICQKSIALRYWYGAWRHGASRQAIDT